MIDRQPMRIPAFDGLMRVRVRRGFVLRVREQQRRIKRVASATVKRTQ